MLIMILLKRGNTTPSVIVLQILLDAVAGSNLRVDGIYGIRTEQAVRGFQRQKGLSPDGIVGKSTWPTLAQLAGVTIADIVDVEDPAILAGEAADIRAAGGTPIILHGMSNGIGQAVSDLRSTHTAGSVAILRFHSHGAPGDMNVSAGTGGDSRADLSGISHDNLNLIRPQLSQLGSFLAAFGCIEFHGCNVGQGPTGKTLLQGVANAAKRPTSAGRRTQYGGSGGYATFMFEGPVESAYPSGMTRSAWANRHQVRQSGPVGPLVHQF
jgi:hypothetical protein